MNIQNPSQQPLGGVLACRHRTASRGRAGTKGTNIMTRALLTYPTTNMKLGPIAAFTTEACTCPDACPLKGGGCYAEQFPMGYKWRQLTAGQIGIDWSEAMHRMRCLPRGVMIRLFQSGDIPGDGNTIDKHKLRDLIVATRGHPVIAYTHKPVIGMGVAARNRRLIDGAIADGLHVNLSGNNGPHADLLADLAIAPVVVILPHAYTRKTAKHAHHLWAETISQWRERLAVMEAAIPKLQTPKGRKVIVCPATYTDTTCAACRICSHDRNGAIVGFPAHGAAFKRAERSCSAPATAAEDLGAPDIRPGYPWVFKAHRTMEEVAIAETS